MGEVESPVEVGSLFRRWFQIGFYVHPENWGIDPI